MYSLRFQDGGSNNMAHIHTHQEAITMMNYYFESDARTIQVFKDDKVH